VTAGYLDRLAARSKAVGSVLCIGLDPEPGALPPGFPADVHGAERFALLIVESASQVAAAFKPNLAFFEAFGSSGIAALERVRAAIPADIQVIADAKRGDIGTTAARQAVALFDILGADAVTVNPYLGEAAVEPLLERSDRFAYVLCRTSNPGAGEFQDLRVASPSGGDNQTEPLHARVARRVVEWGRGATTGLVVGATAPQELAAIRAIAPGLAFLVPGIGAQGGELKPVLEHGPATGEPAASRPGRGLLVNVSRGIAREALRSASSGARNELGERLARAARDWAERLPVLP
jgi:orotidine-5'-phosphate decarboxylase